MDRSASPAWRGGAAVEFHIAPARSGNGPDLGYIVNGPVNVGIDADHFRVEIAGAACPGAVELVVRIARTVRDGHARQPLLAKVGICPEVDAGQRSVVARAFERLPVDMAPERPVSSRRPGAGAAGGVQGHGETAANQLLQTALRCQGTALVRPRRRGTGAINCAALLQRTRLEPGRMRRRIPRRCANLKRVCGRKCRGVPGRRRHALGPETRADCRVDARQGASGNGGNRVLQGIAFRDIRGYRRRETLGGGAFRIGGRHRNRGFPFHKRCHGDLAARDRDAHSIAGHGDAIDQRGARKAARRIDPGPLHRRQSGPRQEACRLPQAARPSP